MQRSAPDVSDIEVDVKVFRFEQDLFSIDTNDLRSGIEALKQKYPSFYPIYANEIIQDPRRPIPPDEAVADFLSYPMLWNLNDSVQQQFLDLAWFEEEFEQLLRYRKYYFPENPTPNLVTVVSEFGTGAFVVNDSLVGMGLDFFLGKNFSGYNPDFFPAFIRKQFEKEYMAVHLAKALAQDHAGAPEGSRLIDQMLYNGKVLFLASRFLPNTPDSLLMGYTREQMEGSYANEQNVWARLLEKNLLYSTDFEEFRKIITPSPDASVLFTEAPGEIGNWIGWRIVEAYMKRFPETTMQQLMALKDAQAFLEQARYRP